MTVGWINREEFGVADGGGGRFVGEGHASPTTEWLTEDERVGTSGWGLSPFTVITGGAYHRMCIPFCCLANGSRVGANTLTNMKRIPSFSSHDPCGVIFHEIDPVMHVNSTKSRINPNVTCEWLISLE